jgi:hypothetical protein
MGLSNTLQVGSEGEGLKKRTMNILAGDDPKEDRAGKGGDEKYNINKKR